MRKYIESYLPYAILAAIFMVLEVSADLIEPILMRAIVDDGIIRQNLAMIIKSGILMVTVAILGGLSGSLNNVFAHTFAQNTGNDIRKDAFSRIMKLSSREIEQFSEGSLITRITNDITQIQNLVSSFIRGMIRTSMLIFGSIYLMFRLNRIFGLITLSVFPLMIAFMAFCMIRSDGHFRNLQNALDKVNTLLDEDINAIRIIKASLRELYEMKRFEKANKDLVKEQLAVLVIFSFLSPSVNILIYLAIALMLLVGPSIPGTTIGSLMAAISYSTQLINGIMGLIMLFQNISRGLASWHRVKEILESRTSIADGHSESTQNGGKIEFRHVAFRYDGNAEPILSDVNFTINEGECVALMGATGSGKSTIAKLITRFYDATEGAIVIDGTDVRDYPKSILASKVSITLQKSGFFNRSIAENISFGIEASENDVKRAARIAQADSFIETMPDKYSTIITEGGRSLSGGQRQRIAIARTVLRNTEILIFDDSTSALDLKTEKMLFEALERENRSTKLIICQRVATAMKADRILIIDGGRIVASGTHEELLKSSSIYQGICSSQLDMEVKNA